MTTWRPRRLAWVLAGALALGLAGCDPSGPSTPRPIPSDVPTATGHTNPGPPSALTPPPASPPPADQVEPSGMPAGDGSLMLWVTTAVRTVYEDGWTNQQSQYGFVDTSGKLVVPARYDGYEYCRDADDRATLVLANSAEGHTDVLDLAGRVVAQVPGRWARCVGDTHAIFQTELSELGAADVGNGLFDLRSQKVLLPVRKGRYAISLDRHTVNVHEAGGEYFLDLATGKETPHPGYVGWEAEDAGTGLVTASGQFIGPGETGEGVLKGYLDSTGKWALEPRFVEAQPFHAGYAIVSDGTTEHIIDTGFRAVGEGWPSINQLPWGYIATRESTGAWVTALYGTDLRVILVATTANVECGWGEVGACGVYPEDGPAKLVLVPEGTVTDLPEGFTEVLSRTLSDDGLPDGSRPATRVHDSASGTSFELARPGSCSTVGTAWISCQPEGNLPPDVYTADGSRTGFRTVSTVPDAVTAGDAPYYWAVAGRYQGFVDATGHWRYRESRYTNLED